MNCLAACLLALLPAALAAGAPGPDTDANVTSPAIELQPVAARQPADAGAAPASEPQPALRPGTFAIDYDLRFGALGGTLQLRLQETATADHYRIVATTRARGLTRLFMARELLEQSDFHYRDDRVVSLQYELDSGKKSGEDTGSIRFDWDNLTAASVHEGSATELQLGEDIYDRISADVVVIMDLRNGLHPRDMRVAEKNQLREYTYTFEAEERIDTPAGSFDTVRYLRQRTGSSRSTRIWYARDTGYLPVQMEQLKDGETAVTSKAKLVTLAGADPGE